MLHQGFKSISMLLIMSACTTILVFGGAKVASAETRQQSVNSVTDWLFGNLYPQLNRRKLRANEYQYIREWQAIWTVINNGGLRYERAKDIRACGIPDWSFQNNDEALKERLADAVFYSRYPERRGRPINPNERAAMREWLRLKNSMYVAYC